MQVIVLSWES